jgi:cyanophycinase-like exopeptidase
VSRLLCIMGSGETSPTMVKTHRAILDRLGPDARAVVLDTPFGFQENAGELTAKAVEYFRESVGRELGVASYRAAATASAIELETMLERVRSASYVFAGPGSPSYALRQWKGTPVHDLLAEKLRHGGAVVFASAAALTLGRFTIPVYEIYKVGAEVEWLDGLDLVAEAGLDCVVVPHWDNAEGGTHDTRYCYMGERRLRMLEAQLPPTTFVLGVDEHTGCLLDLDAGTLSVVGNGGVHLRRDGATSSLATGDVVSLDDLASGSLGGHRLPGEDTAGPSEREPAARSPLLDEVERLERAATSALAAGDGRGVAGAILDLGDTLDEWAHETFSGDEMDRARGVLRALVVRLGEAVVDLGPFIDALLAARAELREAGRYDAADGLRARLVAAGVEVRDTPTGVEWELRR